MFDGKKRKKRENIYLARLFLAIHPKKSGSQLRRTSVKPNNHFDRSNELIGCEIIVEGQQSGQYFTNLGFTAESSEENDFKKGTSMTY